MHRLFFEQLGASGVYASARDRPGLMVGVLLGLVSETEPDLAYVHFHMVDPAWRGRGVGSALYAEFAARAHARGCSRIRALASPSRTGSIAFHEALGFVGRLHPGHLGPGEDRIVFERSLPLG
jgi:ribosomal protein S18 acetylase RimI-like enzyme